MKEILAEYAIPVCFIREKPEMQKAHGFLPVGLA